jgi:outer membrane protein assembly factor BamB
MKIASLVVCCVCTFASSVHAQDWTSFQNGGDIDNTAWKFPQKWSPENGIAWEKELAGYGQSSPIVFGETAYITSVTGPKKETINVEAFSVTEGNRKWIHTQDNSTPQDNTVMISRAAPSPVADTLGVIAMFEGGNLVALDHEGKIRWQRDLAKEFGDVKARHGLSASLEQDEIHVFVWIERSENPYITAIRKSDGEEVWKVAGLGSTSWGSPRLLTVGDSKQLVLSAIGKIVGLDPKTGKQLWSFDDI